MNEKRRAPAGKRPLIKEKHRAEAHFDQTRALEEMKKYVELCVRGMGMELKYEVSAGGQVDGGASSGDVVVSFRGEDEPLLLEHHAELLLALEHIGHRWLRLDPRFHDHVRFDCGDYRATRLDELKLSARVAAQRVRETGQPFRFNPMSSRDRRLIHLELNGAAGVRTLSEGSGDHRQLVIYPVNAGNKR